MRQNISRKLTVTVWHLLCISDRITSIATWRELNISLVLWFWREKQRGPCRVLLTLISNSITAYKSSYPNIHVSHFFIFIIQLSRSGATTAKKPQDINFIGVPITLPMIGREPASGDNGPKLNPRTVTFFYERIQCQSYYSW